MKNDVVDWSEQPLQRWLGGITKKGTKKSYRSAFRAYIKFTGENATQLVDEAVEDAKKDSREREDIVLNRLIGFYNWLKKDYEVKRRGKGEHDVVRKGVSDKLAYMFVNAVRSFYSTFDIVVRLKGRHALPKARVRNKRMKVSADQVKTLLDHARTPRDRAIILTLFQSGMDVSTLCSLKYGDLEKGLKENVHPLKLDLYRPKSGVEYYSFLGRDAVRAVKAYLADAEKRGIRFTHDSPLFVKERRARGDVEGLTTNLVQNMMREVAVKSGLVDEKNNGKAFNPLSPHALRESFGSLMINSGVPDTIIDFWLGHSIGELAEAYKSVQLESLRKMYLEREQLISVTRSKVDMEEVERKVRLEIEESSRELQALVNRLARDNMEMKDQVRELRGERRALAEDLKSVKDSLKTLMAEVDKLKKKG